MPNNFHDMSMMAVDGTTPTFVLEQEALHTHTLDSYRHIDGSDQVSNAITVRIANTETNSVEMKMKTVLHTHDPCTVMIHIYMHTRPPTPSYAHFGCSF